MDRFSFNIRRIEQFDTLNKTYQAIKKRYALSDAKERLELQAKDMRACIHELRAQIKAERNWFQSRFDNMLDHMDHRVYDLFKPLVNIDKTIEQFYKRAVDSETEPVPECQILGGPLLFSVPYQKEQLQWIERFYMNRLKARK